VPPGHFAVKSSLSEKKKNNRRVPYQISEGFLSNSEG